MTPPTQDASARQHAGEPSPVPGRGGDRGSRPGARDAAAADRQIAELRVRSTSELRLAWRQLHRTGPPKGLSRDLLIRALVHQLQERAAGGLSRALRRRLQTLAGEFDKKSASFDPGQSFDQHWLMLEPGEAARHSCATIPDGHPLPLWIPASRLIWINAHRRREGYP